MKTVIGKVAASVEGGSTFSEALAQHPKSFDKLYLNMIRAGEAAKRDAQSFYFFSQNGFSIL